MDTDDRSLGSVGNDLTVIEPDSAGTVIDPETCGDGVLEGFVSGSGVVFVAIGVSQGNDVHANRHAAFAALSSW